MRAARRIFDRFCRAGLLGLLVISTVGGSWAPNAASSDATGSGYWVLPAVLPALGSTTAVDWGCTGTASAGPGFPDPLNLYLRCELVQDHKVLDAVESRSPLTPAAAVTDVAVIDVSHGLIEVCWYVQATYSDGSRPEDSGCTSDESLAVLGPSAFAVMLTRAPVGYEQCFAFVPDALRVRIDDCGPSGRPDATHTAYGPAAMAYNVHPRVSSTTDRCFVVTAEFADGATTEAQLCKTVLIA
jgi:hypothetical protein